MVTGGCDCGCGCGGFSGAMAAVFSTAVLVIVALAAPPMATWNDDVCLGEVGEETVDVRGGSSGRARGIGDARSPGLNGLLAALYGAV